jgi:hypothetical protein
MKKHILGVVLVASAWMLMGGACSPLFDISDKPAYRGGMTLGISLPAPTANRTVAQGAVVPIRWSVANLSGQEAIVTLIAQSRRDFSETILMGGMRVTGTGESGTYEWDTGPFSSGEYAIRARVDAGAQFSEAHAAGRITVNEPPRFVFTDPIFDVTLIPDPNAPFEGGDSGGDGGSGDGGDGGSGDGGTGDGGITEPNSPGSIGTLRKTLRMATQGSGQTEGAETDEDHGGGSEDGEDNGEEGDPEVSEVLIRWAGFDPEGGAFVHLTLDPDEDHTNGNEIVILSRALPTTDEFDSYTFRGRDRAGTFVPADTYNLFARVFDKVNPDLYVEGLARIAVTEVEGVPGEGETRITKPGADTGFVGSGGTFTIEYAVHESAEVEVELLVDTDDNRDNGNEFKIMAARTIPVGQTTQTFEWNGKDSAGATLGDDIYRVVLAVKQGSTRRTVDSPGLIFRRSEANKPLIALLEPSTQRTLKTGDTLNIRWRDDDPSGNAVIRITLARIGQNETEILSGRKAADDGDSDSFAYTIPSALTPGLYTIYLYIDRDGSSPYDHVSLGTARVEIVE